MRSSPAPPWRSPPGSVGYFLSARSVFIADALSTSPFTGALAAIAFGLDARLGLSQSRSWSRSAWVRWPAGPT